MKRILVKVEVLATELFGAGTAISVDKQGEWRWCRVWGRKGELLEEVATHGPASSKAVRQMYDRLLFVEKKRDEAGVSP